jgi:hypothetical protein
METAERYSKEVRERALRLVLEHQAEHGSQCEHIVRVGQDRLCGPVVAPMGR